MNKQYNNNTITIINDKDFTFFAFLSKNGETKMYHLTRSTLNRLQRVCYLKNVLVRFAHSTGKFSILITSYRINENV